MKINAYMAKSNTHKHSRSTHMLSMCMCVCMCGEVPHMEQAKQRGPEINKNNSMMRRQRAGTTWSALALEHIKRKYYIPLAIYIYIQSGIIVCFKRFGLMSIWIIEAISHGKLHMCPSISIDWLYIYIYKEAGMHLHKAGTGTNLPYRSLKIYSICV